MDIKRNGDLKKYYIWFLMKSVISGSRGGLVPEVVIEDCAPDIDICLVKFDGIFNMTMKFKARKYTLVNMKRLI